MPHTFKPLPLEACLLPAALNCRTEAGELASCPVRLKLVRSRLRLTALPERTVSDGVLDSDFMEGVMLLGPFAVALPKGVPDLASMAGMLWLPLPPAVFL